MIKVELFPTPNVNPLDLASYMALLCYMSKLPQLGKKRLNAKKQLFETSHHTTLEHFPLTFALEGISVGDITFGLHLAHPFYNSDQRSGRYAAEMFLVPDFARIENYIRTFWPEVKDVDIGRIMSYIRDGLRIYYAHIDEATDIAERFLRDERPYVSEKSLNVNSPKIAQEQMRMFIPVIFPTAVGYTIDLITLVSMYRVAWTPAMRYVVEKMAGKVLKRFPELDFMFEEKGDREDWALDIPVKPLVGVKFKPEVELLDIDGEDKFVVPNPKDMHPIDKLHFLPQMMDNSVGGLKLKIEVSVAIMGQDQRHRTIARGEPHFTGNFYLPPVAQECGLEPEAKYFLEKWIDISKELPKTLAMVLAPYGAMVTYEKKGSFNAVVHEQFKRLCWCAQEEIYHLGRALRLAIKEKTKDSSSLALALLLRLFEPPCYHAGKCAEGKRSCGRDIAKRFSGDYSPERKV